MALGTKFKVQGGTSGCIHAPMLILMGQPVYSFESARVCVLSVCCLRIPIYNYQNNLS